MFEDVAPGNVSQQLVEETCLARAVFPLHDSKLETSAAAAALQSTDYEPADAAAAAAAADAGSSIAASRLKVLLFDPEDLSHATPAAAAAAFAAAAVTSSSRGATPSPSTAAAAAGASGISPLGSEQGPASHPIVVRSGSSSDSSSSSSSSDNSLSDVGGVEVNVQKLLAAARRGSSSTAAGGTSGTAKGITKISTAGGVSWEGWVRLDKVSCEVCCTLGAWGVPDVISLSYVGNMLRCLFLCG
jgi:hypothetical protein